MRIKDDLNRRVRLLWEWRHAGAAGGGFIVGIVAVILLLTFNAADTTAHPWGPGLGPRPSPWPQIIYHTGIMISAAAALLFALSFVFKRDLAALRLRQGRCPACHYQLDLAGAGDLMTCPECGAAWNRERFTDPPASP